MKFSAQIKPSSWLDSTAAELLSSVDDSAEPIIVTANGRPRMVLMDIHTYETQLETIAFLRLVQMGQKEIEEGTIRIWSPSCPIWIRKIDGLASLCTGQCA